MTAPLFMFATGIENSYPTIHNRRLRVDEMDKGGHYTHWRTDFDLLEDLNVHTLRYGPPIHTTWLGQGRYDWEFCDLTFGGETARVRAPSRHDDLPRTSLTRLQRDSGRTARGRPSQGWAKLASRHSRRPFKRND